MFDDYCSINLFTIHYLIKDIQFIWSTIQFVTSAVEIDVIVELRINDK